ALWAAFDVRRWMLDVGRWMFAVVKERSVNTGTFIIKNALRNKRRAALTILSVAVSCALLVTLLTLQRELTIPPESEAASLRVIVRNKVSLAQPLPAKQLATLDKFSGIVAGTPWTFYSTNF